MKKHEHQPFEQIIEANKSKIYRICRVYAANPIGPEDLFQEVVYQIWKSYSSFKGKSGIDTWIYKIALNVCMRSKGKLDKKNNQTIRLEAIQFSSVENPVNTNEGVKYEALKSCISTLKEMDRSIVILSLEGLPYKAIGLVTGLSENHIAVKMKRIRKQLLHCITSKLK